MIHSEQAEGDGGKKELSFHWKRLLKVREKKSLKTNNKQEKIQAMGEDRKQLMVCHSGPTVCTWRVKN